ncbi:FAD-dependent oxidoreductase [Moritella sp. Urea-trap-13]|uniref:flavin monoamine oxidase family protein n=1 Tax=Moritella sp. Urea-trap-13 TaxID=2058327 RepID=UPI000C338743|nr:FAD-dependent oxidoreductase [Moritella sp. Urea-trap-13]PKH05994.1 monoamine oxidase [Moritella sp. Urea-trap-13]
MKTEFVIVGGGLSGLYTAYLLEQQGKDYILLEGRHRLGGRIYTEDQFDMGPSWFWPELHPRITQLIDNLHLPVFPQHDKGAFLFDKYENKAPLRYESGYAGSPQSMRVAGGMQTVVDGVMSKLSSEHIICNAKVSRVENNAEKQDSYSIVTAEISGEQQTIQARQVIFAMPLRLLASSIKFTPALPIKVHKKFAATATWMAAHAKFFAVYDTPFWRETGLSGSASSQVGPLAEIHDASTIDAAIDATNNAPTSGNGALFGFVGIDAYSRQSAGNELIKSLAVKQLVRIYGEQAAKPIDVKLVDWSQETLTATDADKNAPNAHPHYGLRDIQSALTSVNQQGWFFAGTESAEENGGYIEGALEAAEAVIAQVKI